MIDSIARSNALVMERFEIIDMNVKAVAEQERKIHAAMSEQETESRAVLECLESLKSISRAIGGASEHIHDSSARIVTESRNLDALTAEISGGMQEISVGASQINAAVAGVQNLSVDNKRSIETLVREISKFKVS
jgi:methyl-accepting chemotaxis protein